MAAGDFIISRIKTNKPKGEDILKTVFVMEVLDLIMDNEPRPIWAESITPEIDSKEQKDIQTPPLKLSREIVWENISIRFISDESVEIRAGKPTCAQASTWMRSRTSSFKDRVSNGPGFRSQWMAIS